MRDAVVVLQSDVSGGLAREAAAISAPLVFFVGTCGCGELTARGGGAISHGLTMTCESF